MKEHKVLQIDQIRREKRLDKIIEKGEPEGLREIQVQSKNASSMTEKLSHAKFQLSRLQDVQVAQTEKIDLWNQKIQHIEQRATAMKIDLSVLDRVKRENQNDMSPIMNGS